MKHHFLPKCYLEEFTDPDFMPGQTPHVWICTPDTLKWNRRAPKNVAAMTDYYAVSDGKGGKDYSVERLLSTLEMHYARVLRESVRRGIPLTNEDRAMLAGFVGAMFLRLPGQLELFRERMPDIWKEYMTRWRDHLKQHPEEFERLKAEHEKETGRPLGFTLEEFDPTGVRITTDHAGVVATVFRDIRPLAKIIARMEWCFAFATPPNYFITTDHPIIALYDDRREPVDRTPTGLLKSDVELTVPLSRDIALFAHWRRGAEPSYQATFDQVLHYNLRTATRARDLYVAPKPEFPGHEKVMWKVERDATDRGTAQQE